MRWFNNLKTAQKMMGLIIVTVVFLGLVGYAGYANITKISGLLNQMYDNKLLPIQFIGEARVNARVVETITMELILVELDRNREEELKEEMTKRVAKVDKILAAYANTQLDIIEKEKMAQIKEEISLYRAKRQEAFDLAAAGKREEGYNYFIKNSAGHLDKANQLLEELAAYKGQTAEQFNRQGEAAQAAAGRTIISITILALAFSLFLGLMLARMIANPLKSMLKTAQEVATGNLALEEIDSNSQDEVGQLALAFNTMTANLRNLIKQIGSSAQQVAASSQELSASAEEATQASEQISGNLQRIAHDADSSVRHSEMISATTTQMSAGIQQVAANAQSVAINAKKANNSAQQGNQELQNVINQMNSIGATVGSSTAAVKNLGERSQEIGNIVEVITDIAGQTNLLALNAAIEAARAGEQGKGFAVVAEEVKKLAEQSGRAAEQITALIKHIQQETQQAVVAMEEGNKEVQIGTQVVNRAGISFQEILQAVEEVSTQVQEISAAIEQMAAGTNNLVGSVNQIGEEIKHTQSSSQEIAAAAQEQNASLEEVASSAEMLSSLAENLQAEVSRFKL